MTSVSQGNSDESTNDSITAVPPPNTPEATPSMLEGAPHQTPTLKDAFDIKIVDIAKDGTHHFPDGGFENQRYLDNRLATLVDAAPKDELRVFIAERPEFYTTSSPNVHLSWLPERTKNSAEDLDIQTDRIWGPHDPAQFRQLLRYCLPADQHTAFWTRYECSALFKELFSREILFKWMEVSPEHLICIIVFKRTDIETDRESFLHWISKHRYVSTTRFGDDSLQKLGKLFLMDIMRFITSNEIAQFREKVDDHESTDERVDEDGLPRIDAPDYPIDTLSERIIALLESLNLSTSTVFRAENTGSLDSVAEDLVVRLDFMKQCVKRMKDRHQAELNGYITRSNLRESHAVKRLAILASIFLPLSLGAGILSMQNRFADIHLILWDYVAVCVDMGLLALIFFQVTASPKFEWVKSKTIDNLSSWHYRSQGLAKRIQLEFQLKRLIWKVLGLPGLITVVVALNFGVFGNIQYAWRILVGGVAGGVGLYVLLVIWAMVAASLLDRYNGTRRYNRMRPDRDYKSNLKISLGHLRQPDG